MTRFLIVLLLLPALTHAPLRDALGRPAGAELAGAAWLLGSLLLLRLEAPLPAQPRGGLDRGLALLAALALWGWSRAVNGPPSALLLASAVPLALLAVLPAAPLARRGLPALQVALTAALEVALVYAATLLFHERLPSLLVRFEPERAVAQLSGLLLGLFDGGLAATERGLAHGVDGGGTLEWGSGWVLSGLWTAASALFATLLMAALDGRSGRGARLLRGGLYLALGLAANQGILALLALEQRAMEALFDPWVQAAGLGLLPLLLALATPLAGERAAHGARAPAPAARRAGAALVALGALGSALGLAEPMPDPVPPGGSKLVVAIDEGHSRWERLDIPLDRHTFGTLSVYNYSEWQAALERRGQRVERITEALSEERLAGADVLIVKTPTEPYTLAETAAIQRFVERGGGLFLVGDHNDVFGMNTILNSIAAPFGIRYRDDALGEIGREGGQVIDPRRYPWHPLVAALEPLHFMTSCSLEIRPPAKALLWMTSGFGDDPDFGKNNFIGDGRLVEGERQAPLAQMASARFGRGKVLAFSDSTLLSNFSLYFPGVRQIALGGVAWLGAPDAPLLAPLPWAGLGGLALLLGLWPLRSHLRRALLAGLTGLGLAQLGLLWLGEARFSAAQRGYLGNEIVFDQTLCSGTLPIWHESHDQMPDNFWGLFMAVARSGLEPRAGLQPLDSLSGRAAVFVWPKRPLPRGYMARIERFVASGGTLIVCDDRIAAGSAANELLAPFGLSLTDPLDGRRLRAEAAPEGDEIELGRSASVRGGQALLADSAGDPIAALARHGNGQVLALGLAQSLSGEVMSDSGGPRDERGFRLLQAVYGLLDSLFGSGGR